MQNHGEGLQKLLESDEDEDDANIFASDHAFLAEIRQHEEQKDVVVGGQNAELEQIAELSEMADGRHRTRYAPDGMIDRNSINYNVPIVDIMVSMTEEVSEVFFDWFL